MLRLEGAEGNRAGLHRKETMVGRSSKVAEVFPGVAPDDVLKRLDGYDGGARDRVQLAILKLCEGSLDRLDKWVATAIQDYRDVLAPAEYPREVARTPAELSKMSGEEVQALRDQDRREYLAWLGDEP